MKRTLIGLVILLGLFLHVYVTAHADEANKDMSGNNAVILTAAYSPDGKYIASGSLDKILKIWSMDNWIRTHVEIQIKTWKENAKVLSISLIVLILCILFLYFRAKWLSSAKFVSVNIDDRNKSLEMFDNYMRGFLLERGKLKKFTPETLYKIYSYKSKLEELLENTELTDKDYADIAEIALNDKNYDIASRICEKKGLSVFSPDIVYRLYDGMGKIEKLCEENIPQEWRVKIAGWLYEAKKLNEAYKMISSENLQLNKYLFDILNTFTGHTDAVNSVAFSSDSQYIVSGSSDKTIRIWSIMTGECIKTLTGHFSSVNSVACSPDGEYVASGSSDETIKIWSVVTGECIKTLTHDILVENLENGNSVNSIAFSPDGKYIASGILKKIIKIWSVDDGKCIRILKGHDSAVDSVCYSHKGEYFASGSRDKTIKIWTDNTWKLLKTLKGHDSAVTFITYSLDGKCLTSVSEDNTMKIWSVMTGRCIETFTGLTDTILAVKYYPTNTYMASEDYCKTIKLWSYNANNIGLFIDIYRSAGALNTIVEKICAEIRSEKIYDEILEKLKEYGEVASICTVAKLKFQCYGTESFSREQWQIFIDACVELNKIDEIPKDIPEDRMSQLIGMLEKNKDYAGLRKYLISLPQKNTEQWRRLVDLSFESNDLTGILSGNGVPPELYEYVDNKLFERGEIKELINFMSGQREENWLLAEYRLWFEACLKENLADLAIKSPTKIKAYNDGENIIKMYYDLALQKEAENRFDVALLIYRIFVNENVLYKDVLERYVKLAGGTPRSFSARRPPDETITATSASGSTAFIGKRYDIIREIGRGGMGIVYEGVNKEIGKKVAMKKLKEELAINGRDKKRFMEEARRVAELHHPNIVDIYDMFEEGNNEIYLVFEYVDGDTLDKLLDQKAKLSLEETKKIVTGVCSALEYAHKKKIIHRDIKPSNIMVSSEGYVKVMDFGIAMEAKNTILKVTGVATSGTMAYMAPEQELGQYDERSDIYCLGVTIYEMLSGDLPFKGPNYLAQKREMAYRKIREVMPGLPESIEDIIRKCIEDDKDKRYRDVKELASDVAGIKEI